MSPAAERNTEKAAIACCLTDYPCVQTPVNRPVCAKGEIMPGNERFLTIGALCVFLASPSVALGQSAQARLAKAKAKCVFQVVATASWTNGEPQGEIKPTNLFRIDEIDSDEGIQMIERSAHRKSSCA
jgi:hypothetical protein